MLFRLYPHCGPEHVLAIVVHHIVADGWSLDPLSTDLAEAYRARSSRAVPAVVTATARLSRPRAWQNTHVDANLDDWWRSSKAPPPNRRCRRTGSDRDGEPRGRRGSRRASR
ncbi:hypothetical protein GS497_26485 [Rhodococcus hoagii]|nr:hypothetical protein [Prescottella equi]